MTIPLPHGHLRCPDPVGLNLTPARSAGRPLSTVERGLGSVGTCGAHG